jgi:thiamine pyrophosphokinase
MTSDSTVHFRFQTPAILVGAAPTDLAGLEHCPQDWPIFAADGGVHNLLAQGLQPRAVIGDMDSIGDLGDLADNLNVIHQPGQDDTDFQKCLSAVDAPLIIGFGFLGARYDHSLAALHALASLPDGRPVILLGHDDVMVRVCGDCAFEMPRDTRFSLWPLGRQSFVRSRGLAWPLDGLTFEIGKSIGTSNRVTDTYVDIQAGAGDGYVVIVPKTCWPAVLATALALAGL